MDEGIPPIEKPLRLDLDASGTLQCNLPPVALVEQAIRRGEGGLAAEGGLATTTGKHTGRSPKDRFIVDRPSIHDTVDWGAVNQPLDPAHHNQLWSKARQHVTGRDLYVQDVLAGADPAYCLRVRVITEAAWHSLFARNMFIVPTTENIQTFEPDFTVVQLPSMQAEPAVHGTRSEAAIVVDFEHRSVLICGTHYAGEAKKSIFSVLNYLLPKHGVLPMHCSANVGSDGDVALFFGLSGTGKTTLSADPTRQLIGDDEHGWGPRGVFNFEGGCYAKVIRLSPEEEPEIFAASTRFGAILENVTTDPLTGAVDFDDDQITENTRASYPLDFIPNACSTGTAGHPRHIVMLTADAFGVLPPISKLSPAQAMYHFLSGYTARVAGTEAGVKDPQATFSACFGAPFLPRKPSTYSTMLGELMRRHDVACWLVNTGWSGGPCGTGQRMRLPHTRAMLRAALDGTLKTAPMRIHPQFGLTMPICCPGVPDEILDPRRTWADGAAYDQAAEAVAKRFEANFRQFDDEVGEDVKAAGIHARGVGMEVA